MTNLTWRDYRYLLTILLVGPVIGLPIGFLAGLVLYIFFRLIPGFNFNYKIILLWNFLGMFISTFVSTRGTFIAFKALYHLRKNQTKSN